MKYKPDFLIIPYALYENSSITALDAKLYGVIYYFANMRNERCTASNERLAEYANTTAKTIQNSLTNLEKYGFIRRVFADEQKKQRLEIIPLVVMGKVSPTGDTGVIHRLHKVSPTDDQISKRDKEKRFGVSEETQNSVSNSFNKEEEEEYETVPNEENITTPIGTKVAPRKTANSWAPEKAIFQLFKEKCVTMGLPEPEPAKIWQLKQIRGVLENHDQNFIEDIFDDWFDTASDDKILNVHAALSAHNINKHKMKQ